MELRVASADGAQVGGRTLKSTAELAKLEQEQRCTTYAAYATRADGRRIPQMD